MPKRLHILIFVLRLKCKTIWDVEYTVGKVFSRPFQRNIATPKFLEFQLVNPKNIGNHLATTKHAGQKNHNGKTIVVLFCNVFYECIKAKLGICLLLAMIEWLI
jgi:hypothetical protein